MKKKKPEKKAPAGATKDAIDEFTYAIVCLDQYFSIRVTCAVLSVLFALFLVPCCQIAVFRTFSGGCPLGYHTLARRVCFGGRTLARRVCPCCRTIVRGVSLVGHHTRHIPKPCPYTLARAVGGASCVRLCIVQWSLGARLSSKKAI